VGGLIEEVDIEDIRKALDDTDNVDLKSAYGELLRESRNHLRSYVAEIESRGVVYEAQVLDQATVDAIADSPMERGGSAR
jgi:CRISPR/Cas system CMR-associated protein Cmr5 small subunit